jgi:steroid 5-alpha reductase family enzyme
MSYSEDRPGLIKSYIYVFIAYVSATVGAVGLLIFFSELHPIASLGIADVGATIIIFLFSVIFNNSSFYDPYWSVAPVPVAFFWIVHRESSGALSFRQIIVLILVIFWALRLTWNWISQWKGLSHEDWRYVDMRESGSKNFWVVSFSGIHMFPTILVFAASLSMYSSLSKGTEPFGLLDIIAGIVTFSAVLIEMTADIQLRMFQKLNKNKAEYINHGLWRYSRHPNYFGEVLFWWGLFLFALAADSSYYWTAVGPLAITFLFTFISIPMMEKRMIEKRPNYSVQVENVSPLIPWFPKK